MDDFLKENLEDYLSGTLNERDQAAVNAYLAAHPEAAEEWSLYLESASLLEVLRVDPAEAELDPGFYARVMQRVDGERTIPFWNVFLQPAFVRQLVFAGLMWFAMLGVYVTVFGAKDPSPQISESIVTEQPLPEYNVRMGADLALNRNSMLAVLMTAGD
jgi:anti-sigma factor RsiW